MERCEARTLGCATSSAPRSAWSPLKGTLGDALFAVLCGCGHNIRKILAHLRALLAAVITLILAVLRQARLSGTASRPPDRVVQAELIGDGGLDPMIAV
uniref:Uncharacterized protein n=1 Tax=Cereibacter sphaeroides (strain ATCC 17025 / ATH 2.4.3) TaxID=349102 RepID=A4WZ23_CERS5